MTTLGGAMGTMEVDLIIPLVRPQHDSECEPGCTTPNQQLLYNRAMHPVHTQSQVDSNKSGPSSLTLSESEESLPSDGKGKASYMLNQWL